jgi:DNA-binding LacI/PurR family transcriptional regulator
MKKPTSPSSKLVAAELGVSVATISRALTRPELLSRQTRDRDPALTTVHIPRFDAGYQAMMMLGNVLSQQRAVKSVTLNTRLVIRDTPAPPKRRS